MYRFQTETRHHPPTDCGDDSTPYYARETIERALLSSAGATLILDDLPDEDERPARQREILVATLGQYLFLRREVVDFVCGMHPSLGSEFLVLEVAAGSIRSVDRSRWEEGAEAALPGALAIMSREREGSPIVGRPLERGDLSVTMAYPRLNASGVEWIAQVTEPANYASSDGTWAAYMRSEQVLVPRLPSEFRAAGRIPEAVLRRLAKLPAKHHARGMSWIAR